MKGHTVHVDILERNARHELLSNGIIQPIFLSSWTNLTQPLITYIFQGNCESLEEEEEAEGSLEIKRRKNYDKGGGGEKRGRWRKGGVKLVSVCSNRSSRSLFHSGIFGFFSLDAVARGWALSDFPVCLAAAVSGIQTWALRYALGLPSAWSSPWLRWSPWPAKKIPRKVRDTRPNLTAPLCPLIVFSVFDYGDVLVAGRFMHKWNKKKRS